MWLLETSAGVYETTRVTSPESPSTLSPEARVGQGVTGRNKNPKPQDDVRNINSFIDGRTVAAMVHRLLMRHDDVPQVQGVAAGEVNQLPATQNPLTHILRSAAPFKSICELLREHSRYGPPVTHETRRRAAGARRGCRRSGPTDCHTQSFTRSAKVSSCNRKHLRTIKKNSRYGPPVTHETQRRAAGARSGCRRSDRRAIATPLQLG